MEMDEETLRILIRSTVKETINEMFLTIGIDAADAISMQRDFQAMRGFRETSESVKSKGIIALVAAFFTGIFSMTNTGFHTWLKSLF